MLRLLIVLLLCSSLNGGEIHCKHFFHGMPKGAPDSNDLIIRDCYSLSNNSEKKFADWVAYKLTAHETEPLLDLKRDWHSDPWLDESETLEPKPDAVDDYNGIGDTGYDRGHMAPLASFKGSRYASQVNFYSNITPQKVALNRGPWSYLEKRVREMVKKYGYVWVITGTLYEYESGQEKYLPNPTDEGDVLIPSAFWKVVSIQPRKSTNSIKVAGFIFEQNTERNSPIENHVVTVKEIQVRTGLDLFNKLPESLQATLENNIDAAWVTE
jgi:endonuclease G, mitochondrial